ncbi:hypothetical protein PUN4_160013 [Paraburkholderia unamae]|nr:hypothetical protein PUN4_160013 [Paraburkholderia unamae]
MKLSVFLSDFNNITNIIHITLIFCEKAGIAALLHP